MRWWGVGREEAFYTEISSQSFTEPMPLISELPNTFSIWASPNPDPQPVGGTAWLEWIEVSSFLPGQLCSDNNQAG